MKMMKKMTAILAALVMVLVMAGAAAEETAPAEYDFYGARFGMNMDQVMAIGFGTRYEIDTEHTHGPVTFGELEYEDVMVDNKPADLKFLFVGNELVAIRVCFEEHVTTFANVKAELTALGVEPGPVDMAALGNGIYAVDDDGRLETMAEGVVKDGVMFIIEADHDGDDVDVTVLDMNAAYIHN